MFCWQDESETAAAAQALARCPALANACIELNGELGAGKTTFVRHLLRALGVQGRIKSPTYAVLEPYEGQLNGAPLAISHFDFYRLDDPREFDDAGFREVFAAPGLKLAEWADKLRSVPKSELFEIHVGAIPCDLALKIVAMNEQARCVEVHAHSAAGTQLLEALRA